MPISFDCPHCQRTIKAPDSAAGKRAKCPGCAEVLAIPLQLQEDAVLDDDPGLDEFASVDPDPFAGEVAPRGGSPPSNFATPQAPIAQAEGLARKPAPARAKPRVDYSPLELSTAIAAIVHGVLVTAPLFSIMGFALLYAFTSLTGMLLFAYFASSTTVLICGVAILFKQDWAVPVGATAGGVYFALVAISIIIGTVGMISAGVGAYFTFSFFVWVLPRTIIAWAGPGLLIYMQQNE